jgi:hypothetical protein
VEAALRLCPGRSGISGPFGTLLREGALWLPMMRSVGLGARIARTHAALTPSAALPASAGIQNRDGSRTGEKPCASVCTVSGSGSRAPLKRPRDDSTGLAFTIPDRCALSGLRTLSPRTPLPRHHRACPGDPDGLKRGARSIGMAGSGPAMTAEGVTKVGAGRGQVRDEGVCDPGQCPAPPRHHLTVPARSSPALGPADVITGLAPVIPIGKAQRSTGSGWPRQARP